MLNTEATKGTEMTDRCHIHTCQAPDIAYCQNMATDLVMVENDTLEMCIWCAERAVATYGAELFAPIVDADASTWYAR